MIPRLPQNWNDPILEYLSKNCYTFQQYYFKNINACPKGECSLCKQKGFTHLHHIVPLKDFGANSLKNLSELCPSCHKKVEWGIQN